MKNITIRLIALLLLFVGVIFLQVFLSKKENKFLGLILPVINIMYSIIAVLGSALYEKQTFIQTIIESVMIFLMYNVPTIILIAIYFSSRDKFKKNKEIDKMNIKDL